VLLSIIMVGQNVQAAAADKRGGDVPRLQRHPAQAATFSDRLRRAWAWAQVRALCPVCCQMRP